MVPELGFFALILALALAILQVIFPWLGFKQQKKEWLALVRPLSMGQCFFITISLLTLAYAFVQDDFSVAYVAKNSNAALPLMYKISAIWGGHEGSFLLWIFLYSIWGLLLSLFSRNLPLNFISKVFIVLALLNIGALLFILFASNPFIRLLPEYPLDGQDLNPLLQDPGLIIHPPILFCGYVGFALPFAFAISVLLSEPGLAWAKWLRPWVLAAFAFLTLGIALGSWWAYYELGWGGWWFWDPVENASFMPWLVALALIHCLMVCDKRQQLSNLSLFLCITVFALSLLGAFLVRSGILTSVHAFAIDPKRGTYLLFYFMVAVGSGLTLFAFNSKASPLLPVSMLSREALILVGTVFILASDASILIGTLFPLAFETITHKKLSVGAPFFNTVFIPLMIPVLIFVPLGPFSKWGDNKFATWIKETRWILTFSIMASIFLPKWIAHENSLSVVIGLTLAFWIILGTLKWTITKVQKQGGIENVSFGAWAMILAHLGMGITVVGITVVSNFQIEKEIYIEKDQKVNLSQYVIEFKGLKELEGSNYISNQGHFFIFKNNKKQTELYPEKRIFVVQGRIMTETAIDSGFFRDIYVALGDKITDNAWSARIYYKPFIRWIWLGAIMMALGGILGSWGRRYRQGGV